MRLWYLVYNVYITLLFLYPSLGKTYKPVAIVHGIWDKIHALDFLAERIRLKHPGTNVTCIDMLHQWHSLAPMWYQVNHFGTILKQIMDEHPEGVNLIGYSQGGLVCRGILESFEHNVKTFISLSSPQAGQFGDKFLHVFFPHFVKDTVYKFFYSSYGQFTSVSNYWYDPHHQQLYTNYSVFLPFVNNEKPTNNSATYKKNFIKLKRLVLIGGPDDGVITPWQSSHFGFFDKDETLIEMKKRSMYQMDTFGLRTLDKQKKIIIYEVPGIVHLKWHKNATIIDKYILPWLD